MDISGFLTPDCQYIYRKDGLTHGDMFGIGELEYIHDYEAMCNSGILRIGYIHDTLLVDGCRLSTDQYLFLRRMVGQHSWIKKVFVDDQVYDYQYSRQEFLATQRYIRGD